MTEDIKLTGDEPVGAKSHKEEHGLDELYREVIFEHYRRPHNKHAIADAQIVTKGNNPVCGDRVTVYAKVSPDGRIAVAAVHRPLSNMASKRPRSVRNASKGRPSTMSCSTRCRSFSQMRKLSPDVVAAGLRIGPVLRGCREIRC